MKTKLSATWIVIASILMQIALLQRPGTREKLRGQRSSHHRLANKPRRRPQRHRTHGANRLGGNGVGDIVVNGKIAGRNAAEEISAN